MAYEDIVDKYAAKYNVDPNLIHAIMQQESQGDPNVINPDSKAAGLMQIIPANIGHYGITKETKLDPDTNIRAGVQLLAERQNKYGNDLPKIIKSYYKGYKQSKWDEDTDNYYNQVMSRLPQNFSLHDVHPRIQSEVRQSPGIEELPGMSEEEPKDKITRGGVEELSGMSNDNSAGIEELPGMSEDFSKSVAPKNQSQSYTKPPMSKWEAAGTLATSLPEGTALGIGQHVVHAINEATGGTDWTRKKEQELNQSAKDYMTKFQEADKQFGPYASLGIQLGGPAAAAMLVPEEALAYVAPSAGRSTLGRVGMGMLQGGTLAAAQPAVTDYEQQNQAETGIRKLTLGALIGGAAGFAEPYIYGGVKQAGQLVGKTADKLTGGRLSSVLDEYAPKVSKKLSDIFSTTENKPYSSFQDRGDQSIRQSFNNLKSYASNPNATPEKVEALKSTAFKIPINQAYRELGVDYNDAAAKNISKQTADYLSSTPESKWSTLSPYNVRAKVRENVADNVGVKLTARQSTQDPVLSELENKLRQDPTINKIFSKKYKEQTDQLYSTLDNLGASSSVGKVKFNGQDLIQGMRKNPDLLNPTSLAEMTEGELDDMRQAVLGQLKQEAMKGGKGSFNSNGYSDLMKRLGDDNLRNLFGDDYHALTSIRATSNILKEPMPTQTADQPQFKDYSWIGKVLKWTKKGKPVGVAVDYLNSMNLNAQERNYILNSLKKVQSPYTPEGQVVTPKPPSGLSVLPSAAGSMAGKYNVNNTPVKKSSLADLSNQ